MPKPPTVNRSTAPAATPVTGSADTTRVIAQRNSSIIRLPYSHSLRNADCPSRNASPAPPRRIDRVSALASLGGENGRRLNARFAP